MSVRMDRDEAWKRIAASHTGIITSLRADGFPISVPMWFCVVDGAVHFSTRRESVKVRRLRRDPRVGFLVESGERWAELWAVHLVGTVTFVDDEALVERVEAAMTAKYSSFRSARSSMPDETREHYERPSVVIRIDAEERIVSWDNRKLGLS
ncbi:MAG: pyridoxamine 5'-phosphate oxidase family protein [Actinomycetes bacterium]